MTTNDHKTSNILVVDDNETNVDILVEVLGKDYDVSVALDGETALEDIETNPPSLILLDIMMPGLDGYEVCRRVRSNKKLSNIPIIFLTGMDDLRSKTLGFELGAVDYITKPFQLPELRARVKTHVELKLYRDHIESLVKKRTVELEKANANLQELLKNEQQLAFDAKVSGQAKSDFINIVSHELRTPLNAIIGMNDLLLMSELDTQQEEFAQIVKENSENLLGIIDDILDFSEIDTGKMCLESINFRMDDIVKDIVEILSTKNVKFLIDINPNLPNALIGDALRLKRIISNLIDNALKFSKEKIEIILSINYSYTCSYPPKVMMSFNLKDNGIGMSSEDIAKIFKEPFTQVETSFSRSYGGLGLGLSICKSLIEMMDGKIKVESEPGKGSSFIFSACFQIQADEIPFEFPSGIENLSMV
ncbi:response regulator receiver sensor signal transduction histidine kinase [Candidatus Magnetomorum sp. HK-1]|nr:response regulator receiver sensor signal transduction histidine kinase [Candidatus Magnetomorum sp. HK-1]